MGSGADKFIPTNNGKWSHIGEEVRLFEFGWGVDRIPYALYMLTQSDNEGYTILDRGIAYFEYGNPENLIGVAP